MENLNKENLIEKIKDLELKIKEIDSKIEEVKTIISNEFLETCTIYNVEGGYSKENKKIIRCALEYKEAKLLKAMMPAIDKNAFITEYESTSTIGGSTFDAYVKKEEKDRILNLIKKK